MKIKIFLLVLFNFNIFLSCQDCNREIKIIKQLIKNGDHYEAINKLKALNAECYNGYIEIYIYYYAWASMDKGLENIVKKIFLIIIIII